MSDLATIVTVGHGTLPASAFAALVRDAGVGSIVDVRRFPGSRRNPQFGRDEMNRWLPEVGVAYRWMEPLGGRRKRSPESLNRGLRNSQFRAYADHMSSTEFGAAVDELPGLRVEHRFHHGRRADHPITPGARRADGHVLYDSVPA